MTPEQAVVFLLFAVAAAGTPGPSNLLLTATGANVGVLRGLPCLFGVTIGMGVMMFVVAFGLGSVVLANPPVLRALNWIGAAFLLWLAWKMATAGRSDAAAGRKPVGFIGAAAFQWINPKSWLVCASAAGAYLDAESGSAPRRLWLSAPCSSWRPCPVASCGWPSAPPRSDFYARNAPGGRSISPWVCSWPDRLS